MPRISLSIAGGLLLCSVGASGIVLAQASKPAGDVSTAWVDGFLRTLIAGAAGASSWTATDEARALERLCEAGKELRLALALTKIVQPGQATCKESGRTVLFQKAIGWVIVVPVTRPGGAFNLTSTQLFRALAAADDGQAPRPAKWSEVDPALPDNPIRVLLPAAGSLEDRTLAATALSRGCVAVRGQKLPAAGTARMQACGALRNDAALARAQPGAAASAWLRTAPAGAVAFVGYGQLAADGDLAGLMTLDGRLASSAALLASDYSAALPVYALATRPSGSSERRGEAAVSLGDALLSENAIGPYGNVALRGLAPLPAQERIALRSAFSQFLTKTGVWE